MARRIPDYPHMNRMDSRLSTATVCPFCKGAHDQEDCSLPVQPVRLGVCGACGTRSVVKWDAVDDYCMTCDRILRR